MSLLPVSVVAFLIAALLGGFALASGRRLGVPIRLASCVAALAMVWSYPHVHPFVALGFATAAMPSPLSCMLGSAVSLALFLSPSSGQAVSLAPLGLGAVLVSSSVSSSLVARLSGGLRLGWVGVAGGVVAPVLLVLGDQRRVLHWGFGLGANPRLDLPGVGLLLGLGLLASLAGSALLAADLLTAPDLRAAGLAGRRLILGAAGLSVLGAGLALVKAFSASGDWRAGREPLGLILAVETLVLTAMVLLSKGVGADVVRLEEAACRQARLGGVLVVLTAAASMVEGFVRFGTYRSPLSVSLLGVALLGLMAVQKIPMPTLRRTVFLLGLLNLIL